MHVLFVHQNFPAQFGHVAQHLTARHGWRCTFATEKPAGVAGGVERVQYRPRGGATQNTHYCTRTFENQVAHAHGIYEALKARPDVRPDLIVGHSGLGPTLFLRDLYPGVPTLSYCEYFYHPSGTDMDFRPETPVEEINRLRAMTRNAALLLDLHYGTAAYSPTRWQRSLFPAEYQDKIRVVFDGIDTAVWHPQPAPRTVAGVTIPPGAKVVTYATRGMEAMRGFDVFMKFAKKLGDRRPDVLFLVAGQDRVCYGGDAKTTGGKTFKEWVLAQDDYDLRRFAFLGLIPPAELARLFAATDLHVYLTVPFVLSWSLLNALACGAPVLASDTAPVREVITDGQTGLLAGFFDVDGMVERAVRALDRPDDFRHLRTNGENLVRKQYALDVCLPQLVRLFEEAAGRRGNE